MDFPEVFDRDTEEGDASLVERMMLGAVRLASLPVLVLVIVLASLIYGLASLIRNVISLAGGLRRCRIPLRTWNVPIEARDA